MTSPNDIVKAIRKLLAGLYPGEMVYVNLVPKDFARPSTLVELAGVAREDAGKDTVRMTVEVDVTSFVKTDGHYNSDTEKLAERQDGVMGLFGCGYIKVGDRCISVEAAEGSVTFTDCTVGLTFDYFDDRAAKGPDEPVIEKVNTKYILEDQ